MWRVVGAERSLMRRQFEMMLFQAVSNRYVVKSKQTRKSKARVVSIANFAKHVKGI